MSTIFQAVWPVTDDTLSYDELKNEALADLENVARRHKVKITGTPTAKVRLGKDMPGAGDATLCVVVEAEAVKLVNPRIKSGGEVACGRCGIVRGEGSTLYCNDCKQYAAADGWYVTENAA